MRWIIVPILLLNFNTVFSQTNQHCEKLYYIPDKLPEYEGGQPALMIFYAQKNFTNLYKRHLRKHS